MPCRPRPPTGCSPPAAFRPPVRSRTDRKAVLSHFRAFDRRTKEPGRHGGRIGDRALRLLEILAFKLSDPETGFCVASYAEMQKLTGWARSTVIEAAGVLVRAGAVFRQHLAGEGPYGQGPNGWGFPDPALIFQRLFGRGGVRGADPIGATQESSSLAPPRPKRDRRLREEVIAEVERQGEAEAVPDSVWDALVRMALHRAKDAEHAEKPQNLPPAASRHDPPARPSLIAWLLG